MYRRYSQKREMQLRWMAKFGCSTSDLLIGLSGVKNTKTMYSLKNSGLIDCFRTDVLQQKIWHLTNEGRKLAAEWEPAALGRAFSHGRFSFQTLRHDLSLQAYLLTTQVPLDRIVSERCIPNHFEHIPDALIKLDDSIVAIELERSHKSKDRVFRIFMQHCRAIFNHCHYGGVRYVFPNDALAARYLALFNTPDWPMFKYDRVTRKYVPQGKIWTPPRGTKGIDPSFQFLVMEDSL